LSKFGLRVLSGLYSILEMMNSLVMLLSIVTTILELLEDVSLLSRYKGGNSRRQIMTAKSSLGTNATHLKSYIYLFSIFVVPKKLACNLNPLQETCLSTEQTQVTRQPKNTSPRS